MRQIFILEIQGVGHDHGGQPNVAFPPVKVSPNFDDAPKLDEPSPRCGRRKVVGRELEQLEDSPAVDFVQRRPCFEAFEKRLGIRHLPADRRSSQSKYSTWSSD
jgi:hypothetical protein